MDEIILIESSSDDEIKVIETKQAMLQNDALLAKSLQDSELTLEQALRSPEHLYTDIYLLFQCFHFHLFHNAMPQVSVSWSKRLTRCAGLCRYQRNSGFCEIRLSEPLLQYRPRSDLIDTLLHEMIHAYLFVTERNTDREGHGPTFQEHMKRINTKCDTRITIFHSFHNEVRHYQKHVWRCNGPCRDRPPFYGWVRRAMNRPPQKADWWFAQHQRDCGGEFIKTSEN